MTHHSEDQECKEPLYKSGKLNTDDYLYREYLTYTFGSLVTDNNAVFESQVTTETELEDHGIRYCAGSVKDQGALSCARHSRSR